MNLKLKKLSLNDESAFLTGLKDWPPNELDWYCAEWGPDTTFNELLIRLEKNRAGIELPPSRVPSSLYYAFVDGRIVGRVHIRHHLNEYLFARGGHVGYAVAERFRRLGYGREILRQALLKCKEQKIDPVMVSCSETNLASIKIIESFSARLFDQSWDEQHQEFIRRYWI